MQSATATSSLKKCRRAVSPTTQKYGSGGIAGTICVECLKWIIDRSECVMEVAFRRKEEKRATLANPCPS